MARNYLEEVEKNGSFQGVNTTANFAGEARNNPGEVTDTIIPDGNRLMPPAKWYTYIDENKPFLTGKAEGKTGLEKKYRSYGDPPV